MKQSLAALSLAALIPLAPALSANAANSITANSIAVESSTAINPPTTLMPGERMADEAAGNEQVVTDTDNGSEVTLQTGNTLVVRLQTNPSTGYSWGLVSFPDMPLRLVSRKLLPKAPANGNAPAVGGPRIEELRFVADENATHTRVTWLKLVQLRPFQKGIENAQVWEIKVTVPGS